MCKIRFDGKLYIRIYIRLGVFVLILEKSTRDIVDRLANIARNQILGKSYSNDDLAEVLNDIFDINIYYSDTKKFDGYLGTEDIDGETKPMIVLNKNQSKERQLFTLAHELGHLVLHYGYLPGLTEKINTKKNVLSVSGYHRDIEKIEETTDPLELQANEFAGAFLMPKESVLEKISNLNSFADKVEEISKNFGVTEKAASKRIRVLKESEVHCG